MKILLDTNIIIHREASKIYKPEIGQLFKWIDNLKYSKYIHPLTVEELERYKDPNALDTMSIKIQSYNLLKHQAPLGDKIIKVSKKIDNQENDINDTQILNEVYEGRVDILISEDKKIHTKAKLLGIENKVFKIQNFLEKATSENRDLVDFKVLAVKKVDFAEVNLKNSFFDSFREDYLEFDSWFNDKSEDSCYVCYSDGNLTAFLFVKIESEKENYSNISPVFQPKKRLKIGTLKVTGNGYKIGERFLKLFLTMPFNIKLKKFMLLLFTKRPEQEH